MKHGYKIITATLLIIGLLFAGIYKRDENNFPRINPVDLDGDSPQDYEVFDNDGDGEGDYVISINGKITNAESSSQNINIVFRGPFARTYYISEDPAFTGANAQPYEESIVFTVSAGLGLKTLYYKFIFTSGEESKIYSNTVVLNPAGAEGEWATNTFSYSILEGTFTTNTIININITAPTNTQQMRLSTNSDFSGSVWENYISNFTTNFPFYTAVHTNIFYLDLRYGAANRVLTNQVVFVPWQDFSFSINGMTNYCHNSNISLHLSFYNSVESIQIADNPGFSGAQTLPVFPLVLPWSLSGPLGYREIFIRVTNSTWGLSYTDLADGIYYYTNNEICVSAGSGNDSNSGTAALPLENIQTGLDLAQIYGITNVYLESGIYTKNNGLGTSGDTYLTNDGIVLSGGWNSSFTAKAGQTVLDKQDDTYYALYCSIVTNCTLTDLVFAWDPLNYSGFSGIYAYNMHNSLFSNIVIKNHYNAGSGGGAYFQSCNNNLIYLTCISNISSNIGNGGGVCLDKSHNNYLNLDLSYNASDTYGGGLYLTLSTENYISGRYISNITTYPIGTYGGGGIALDNMSHNNVISALISGNAAGGSGGGIYIGTGCEGNLVDSNTVVNNNTAGNGNGGGTCLRNNRYNTNHETLYGNRANGAGGGGLAYIDCDYSRVDVISYNNYAEYGGGGIRFSACRYIDLSGRVFSNRTARDGGGLEILSSEKIDITADISSNYSGEDGGGICIRYSGPLDLNSSLSNNYAGLLGGGIFVDFSSNVLISSIINTNDCSGEGGGIYAGAENGILIISNSDILNNGFMPVRLASFTNGSMLIDSTITSNRCDSGFGNVIIENLLPLSDIIVSNNVFTGTGIPGSIAIVEAGLDLKGHVLMDNHFYTNSYGYIYSDTVNGSTNDINAINNTNYSGAAKATNNTASN